MKRTSTQMYPVVEAYLSSDQTQDSFCSEAGISVAVLNYWLKKYRNEHTGDSPWPEPPPSFVQITPSTSGNASLEVSYPGGIRLRFDRVVPVAYLRELLRVTHR